MKFLRRISYILIFITLFLSGCRSQSFRGMEKANNESHPNMTIVETIILQRSETAFSAYEVAKEVAVEWNSGAELYEIPTITVTSQNIDIVTYGQYWFFIFGTRENSRKLYIAVADGKILGSIQAQPIVDEILPYIRVPLDLSLLIDNDIALKKCFDYDLIKEKEVLKNEQEIDYRLVNLNEKPVWSLFLTGSDPFIPVCNIDAMNGEMTEDPYTSY